MSTQITHCAIATGHLEGTDFGPAGHEGDWALFPASFTTGSEAVFDAAPRVIVTPILEDDAHSAAFPVCVVRDVSATGFTLAARNRATHGFAAFAWMAVLETPGVLHQAPDVSTGVLPPLFFEPADAPGDQSGTPSINQLDNRSAAVLLTATDQEVTGHSVAAVGVLRNDFTEGIGMSTSLAACNSDCASGGCAFNWARFPQNQVFVPGTATEGFTVDAQGVPNSITEAAVPEFSIETGEVAAERFQPSGEPGDWRTWDIRFTDRFAAVPVILVTADKAEATPSQSNPAVVGVVQAVTPHGFRLAARNSDCAGGEAGFNWVAIGLPSR